jgi:hypothetical protein
MKRLTKAQKEEAARQKLLEIVHAVYCGAMGGDWDEDQFATAEILSRVIPALQSMFPAENRDYMWRGACLQYFDTAESATEHLFTNGVRT